MPHKNALYDYTNLPQKVLHLPIVAIRPFIVLIINPFLRTKCTRRSKYDI